MQFSLALLVLTATVSAAWNMDVSYDDRTKMTYSGHKNSHCTKFKKHSSKIDNVYFKGSTLADTYELFSDDKCKELVYKGKKGSSPVPHRVYGSYKVY